jgi:hypothetical protein
VCEQVAEVQDLVSSGMAVMAAMVAEGPRLASGVAWVASPLAPHHPATVMATTLKGLSGEDCGLLAQLLPLQQLTVSI